MGREVIWRSQCTVGGVSSLPGAWPRATEARQHSLEISTEPEMMNGGEVSCMRV